jgi:hypothetical protein
MNDDPVSADRSKKRRNHKDKKERDSRSEQKPAGLPDLAQRLLMIYERAIKRASDTDSKT